MPFAGWEMPVQYEGIRQEHVAVRTDAGKFDVSHMGEVETSGPDAERFLQSVLSNDVSKIAVGGAQYSVLCREDGGVLDDLFTYRLDDDRYLTVTNAANHERDFAWLAEHAQGFDVEVRDVAADYAMIALQGPRARAVLGEHLEGEAPARMRVVSARVAGVDCLVCGTGYTGEDGVELLIPPDGATAVWDALDVTPAGLGARDTLRLEVCFHLYGNDLSEDRNPIEAGLGWCCKLDTGFIGSDALRGLEPPRRSCHSPSPTPAFRGRETRSSWTASRVGWSRAAATRPASGSASGWRTFQWTPPRPGPMSRSTCAASGAEPRSARNRSTRRRTASWPRRPIRPS